MFKCWFVSKKNLSKIETLWFWVKEKQFVLNLTKKFELYYSKNLFVYNKCTPGGQCYQLPTFSYSLRDSIIWHVKFQELWIIHTNAHTHIYMYIS
jgi:hypothetical protein